MSETEQKKSRPPYIRYGGATINHYRELATIGQLQLTDYSELFSDARMSRYVSEVGKAEAIAYYLLNAEIASRIFKTIGIFEVAFRNHVARALHTAFGQYWMLDDNLDEYAKSSLLKTKDIAELTFGFWVHLIGVGPGSYYDKVLWKLAIQPSLVGSKLSYRKSIHKKLKHIQVLRNRIAHHEPVIFGIPIKKEAAILSLDDVVGEIVELSNFLDERLHDLLENMLFTEYLQK